MSLLNTPEIRKLESRFISLFERTFLKAVKGKPAPSYLKSVKIQFKSKTFQVQVDGIIDDIYLHTIGYTDSQLEEQASASQRGERRRTFVSAAAKPLPITEDAVRQAVGLSQDVTESIIKILKDDGIYLEHPDKLEKRVRDLWGGQKYRAVRFARTFTADVATNTSLWRYNDAGIEELQFYAKIDDKTSDQCRTLHGTIFSTDSKEAANFRPPLHFHCRSDLLPIPITQEVDPKMRYENRDFTKQMDQEFGFIDDKVDKDLVKKTFSDIDTFNEKYRIDQFILDEDIEARLQKLNVKVLSEIPGETAKTKVAILKDLEDEIRDRTLEDGEKGYLIDEAGKVIFEKVGKERSIRFTPEELKMMKGKILTHSHPSGGSFSPEDLALSSYHGLKEVRAAGKYRTYSLKTISGDNLQADHWEKHIAPYYQKTAREVKTEFQRKIDAGDLSLEKANALHWHEVWTRVFENVDILDYTYTDIRKLPK